MARFSFFIASVVLVASAGLSHAAEMLYADHPLVNRVWDMNNAVFVEESELMNRLNNSDVLLLGEVHDNLLHHELQQKLLQARIDSGAQPALMMEQIDTANQTALDEALSGSDREVKMAAVNKLISFNDWKLYSPLLEIAVDHQLPVIASNIPSRELRPVIWRGYDAYDADKLKHLAVEEVWNENRQKFLAARMGGAHCGQLREELRIGLTRSQRLKDALMADSAISSITRGVVGIVGSSHARRDIGLPLYFSARDPEARIVSVGFVEVVPKQDNPYAYTSSATGEVPFDYVWFTPRMAREDPCAGVNMAAEMVEPVHQPSGEVEK
ncbi:MAG: ChaN family lipoprotein [Gallionella sp.]